MEDFYATLQDFYGDKKFNDTNCEFASAVAEELLVSA